MKYIFLRFPGGRAKALTLSYDDGYTYDLHLAEILGRYDMKCTFNIFSDLLTKEPGENRLDAAQMRSLIDAGHEIAVHGASHVANGLQTTVGGISEAYESRKAIERELNIISRGYAYPNSGINDFTSGMTYEKVRRYLCDLGFSYARSDEREFDYFRVPEDWFNWCPTAHHNNKHLFEYVDLFINDDPNGDDGKGGLPMLFHIFGHTVEFEHDNNWDRIESICEKLGGRDDTWYATNIEVYDYVQDFLRLQLSLDQTLAYNPSAQPVWVQADRKVCRIDPGKTVSLI